MTIRRGWLGKRLFIATHIQRSSMLYTLRLWMFRIEFGEAKNAVQFTERYFIKIVKHLFECVLSRYL